MKISKNKKMSFFIISHGSLNPKVRFLGQKVCAVARGHTDTQTHSKVTTVDTLSGFQDFSLQPIIKDRPNINNPSIFYFNGRGAENLVDILRVKQLQVGLLTFRAYSRATVLKCYKLTREFAKLSLINLFENCFRNIYITSGTPV